MVVTFSMNVTKKWLTNIRYPFEQDLVSRHRPLSHALFEDISYFGRLFLCYEHRFPLDGDTMGTIKVVALLSCEISGTIDATKWCG